MKNLNICNVGYVARNPLPILVQLGHDCAP